MRQVFDSVTFVVCLPSSAHRDVAFRSLNNVGTRNETVCGAGYPLGGWACVYPCRCYTNGVTTARVRRGAGVSDWDFAVRLFHSQLQAGLSRRFLRHYIRCPLSSRWSLFTSRQTNF
jgi:hypothetical protein